ncbi:hypothetical protein JG687_00016829 [Phytophthora cactorum]|uniref:Flavoprotein-like domain n=1 Tax=Phytophthora cactorum TaxID=29920 RepID=A0A8T1TPZ8_9STRA|nr:hypothetical protein JG687_00016829 [Phytophthora cactorum]
MLTVTCVLLGFNIPPFAVDFEGDDTIGDLKALIKTQQQNTLKCDSSDLELHLAAKDGYWLADDDYLVVKLENGDINDETHELISATPVDSKTLVLNWWEDKNMPQPSSGQIHVFVKVPVRCHPQPWSISVSVYDAMDTAIAPDKDVILWYEGTTLNARVLFKTERIALLFGSDLHEEVATEMSPLEGLTIQTKDDHPIATLDTLKEVDGILFGFPCRFGSMPAQVKAFFDSCGSLCATGALVGKTGGLFFSTGTQGGGQETTASTAVTFLAHQGMTYIPLEYRGKGCGGSRQPSELELALATTQGKSFAQVTKKLAA